MSLLRHLASGLRSLFEREHVNRELDEELGAYLEMAAAEKMKQGMNRNDAVRAVRLERGTLELAREVVLSGAWESVVKNCWRDLRFATRMLRKAPGFTAVAVLTLALGIGANTAIFSLLNAVMLKTMPVSRPKQLVILRWSAHNRPENLGTSSYGDCQWVPGAIQSCSFSFPMYKALFAHADAFSSVLAMAGAGQLDLSGNGPASMVGGELVSGNYFDALGVSSVLGRTIQPSDDRAGAPPVVVLNFGYWQRAFGGAADVIGRTVRLNSSPFTIAGVIDPQFTRLTPGNRTIFGYPFHRRLR
jgi:MacB-like periplasmic core domain